MLKKYKTHIIIGAVIIAGIAAYYFYNKKKANSSKNGNGSLPAATEDDPTSKMSDVKTETDKMNLEWAQALLN